MANKFTNNTKVKLVAGAVADAMDYTKASVSKMSQGEFKGKKFGRSYQVYIPTTGKVVEGTEADPSEVTEVPSTITLNNFNVSVELGPWNTLADIEDFAAEIAKPLGTQLGRTEEKKIVAENVYKSLQTVVAASASFAVLGQASAALRNLAVGSEIVSFLNPDVAAAISASGLANFLPSEIQKRVYSDNYLGQYASAAQIESPDLPVLTTPNPMPSASVTLTQVTDDDSNVLGFEVVDKISGTGLKAGLVYKASGLKVVDQSGIETDQEQIGESWLRAAGAHEGLLHVRLLQVRGPSGLRERGSVHRRRPLRQDVHVRRGQDPQQARATGRAVRGRPVRTARLRHGLHQEVVIRQGSPVVASPLAGRRPFFSGLLSSRR